MAPARNLGVAVQADLFAAPGPPIYRVREINEAVRALLDEGFGEVTVEGEISNAKQQAASGHWYFSLKDDAAELQAVLFRSDAQALRFQPENGLLVHARGRLGVYVRRGAYQMQVRALQPVGQGALELAFRQLCARLEAEGLFDPARKLGLPRLPRRIAVVTSPTGAAVRDVLTTLAARWPLARIVLLPVQVQGDAAPREIVQALRLVDRARAADVVLLVRGGGSLEDLWAFNDEAVARAIVASMTPIVTGIGHETDVTIADLVADRRGATPTAAAVLVVPSRDDARHWLDQVDVRGARALRRRLELPRQQLETLLRSYGLRRLRFLVPEHRQTLDARSERLERAARAGLARALERWQARSDQLQALGPRRVLARGYAYVVDAATGAVVSRADAARTGQDVRVVFADAARAARITGEPMAIDAPASPGGAARATPATTPAFEGEKA
jgi:exodeoxyribonuclease VII large subunit